MPDDDSDGGKVFFEFDQPVYLKSLVLIDIEENNTKIILENELGESIKMMPVDNLGDNSYQKIIINESSVKEMIVELSGSGGIDDIEFCFFEPEAIDAKETVRTNLGILSQNTDSKEEIALFNEYGKNNNTLLFPNPSFDDIHFTFPAYLSEQIEINVYDILGKHVFHTNLHKGTEKFTLTKRGKTAGIYLVHIQSGDYFETAKFNYNKI